MTTHDMVRTAGASPNALKVAFRKLVDKLLLERQGGGRSIRYRLP